MANHKSSEKRAKQDVVKTARNRANESVVKTYVKKTRDAIEAKDKSKASELLALAQKYLSRLAKTGVIKRETAARKTSRLASQVNSL